MSDDAGRPSSAEAPRDFLSARRMLDADDANIKRGYLDPGEDVYLWVPSMTAVRQTARFKAYIRAAGLVDYRRLNSWPDLRHPTTGDDFKCS